MRITRARYVTVCQQFLVTATVLAVGLSAAGVMTLQIVAPEAREPRATGLAPAITVSDAYVDTSPVTPEVREVEVRPVAPAAAREIPGAVTGPSGPSTAAPKKLAAVSAPTRVHGYATVGATWKPGTELGEDEISVQVRTRTGGTWSGWTTAAYHDEHGPDAGTPGAARVRPGTDALVVGDVDEVQMRAATTDGVAPADLELAVVDPGAGELTREAPAIDTAALSATESSSGTPDAEPATTSDDQAALMAMKVAPKPQIYSRAQWGANESLRDKSSLRYGTIKTGFIHHTVNANSYTADQVPALIRGIYAYHTQSRGWSDIGYNFLVDRFGRIWEGRYGGVDRPVVGAHTLGYNEYSFAMSAIGNFDIASPPQAVLDAYARLFAWKLSLSNIRADATRLWVKDRYLQAINGHRDVGKTACPGRYLYAKLPAVRVATQAIQNRAQTSTDPVNLPMVPPPAGLPSPLQTPAPASPQPSITFPARTSVAGTKWPDLLTVSSTGRVSVVPTEGMLDYRYRVVNKGTWASMSVIAAVGDLTGDGRSDVLAKNARTGVTRVFPGDGWGHVAARGIAPTRAFQALRSFVGVRDFDRDGKNDVVALSRKAGALLLFRGKGRGEFRAPLTLRRSWKFTKTTGAGDVDRDGQPDLVATADGRSIYLFPGASRGRALGKPVRMTVLPTAANALLGWGDANGDRRPDILTRVGAATTLHAGTGTARAGQAFGPFLGLGGLDKLSLAPMLGSAAPDAVGRNAAGELVVVMNNGQRNLSAPLPSNLVVSGATQVFDVGDWNRDGRSDVVVRTSDRTTLVLYPGLGNGKFGRPRSLGSDWKWVIWLASVGDVTGDGYPDLVGRTTTGPMTIFPGAGDNAFKAPVLAPASLRTYNQIGATAWSPGGSVFPSANGTFVPAAGTDPASALRMTNGTVVPAYDTYVGVGDVNGDGVADLLAREKGTGIIWLLPGKTSGGFAPRMWVANGFAGYRLVG